MLSALSAVPVISAIRMVIEVSVDVSRGIWLFLGRCECMVDGESGYFDSVGNRNKK
jgi:hypothetical protein